MNETLIGSSLTFSPELSNIAIGAWLGVFAIFVVVWKIAITLFWGYIILRVMLFCFEYLNRKKPVYIKPKFCVDCGHQFISLSLNRRKCFGCDPLSKRGERR